MPNELLKRKLKEWKVIVGREGISLPNGSLLPNSFWPVFLGLSEEELNAIDSLDIKPEVKKILELNEEEFIREVHLTITYFLTKNK